MSGEAGTIAVDGLTRRFGDTTAVHPFRLDVGPGLVTGLLGPNGSGKSTLLRMLLGLVRPDAGRATVAGVRLAGDGTAVRRRVAYMPGEIAVYGELSGRDHLRWFAEGRPAGTFERGRRLAEELGLPLGRRVRGYSHGMKRQLFFAAAMAPDVRVRVLDEPTEGLDPSKRGRVLELLRADAERGVTILLSSHHLGEVEKACDRMLFLREGRLLDEAAARRVRARARDVVRLRFEVEPGPDAVAALCARLGAELARAEGREATLFLPGADPREELRDLLADAGLPRLASLVFGELSLHELYRELYGEEGV